MKLLDYFKAFLENEVNLNESRITLLDERMEAITNFLKSCPEFAAHFVDVVPQGSYAHKTIIRPVHERHEFDADLLLHLDETEGWEAEDYVEELYRAFRNSKTYRDMVGRKTRCVTVNYAGDFHIDVVPYLERHGGYYVTNRHENRYELTNPEGYNAWLDDKNRTAGRNFVKLVRLIKYLRDFMGRFGVKSIILNTLLGEQVSDGALLLDTGFYKDLPTTLRNVMNGLSDYMRARPLLPTILDPSGTGESFSDRWDQDGYANFRAWITHYAKKIDEAYLATDKEESLAKWQEIFGTDFQVPKAAKSIERVNFAANALIPYRNTEQQLSDVGISLQLVPDYILRVSGRVIEKPGFRGYDLAKYGNRVKAGRTIRLKIAKCNVPLDYNVYWKVKNNGEEAKKRDCIRGEIVIGSTWKDEPTAFSGPHYVECYIVKNGICVATDRQEVIID
jgi:hypothetical protein